MVDRQHRARVPVAFPDAPVGTCKHCGKPCGPRRRTHDDCRERQAAANDYRGAARVREGEKQRCVDCRMVEGQTRRVAGDYPGGWKWERVVIQRDHPQELIDNGPRDWTVARCSRCHQEKTKAAAARRRGEKEPMRRPSWGPVGRWLAGLLLIGVAAWWWTATPSESPALANPADLVPLDDLGTVLKAVAGISVVAFGLYVWGSVLASRHSEALLRLGDAIARETHTDPSRVRVRVKRWRKGLPVAASVSYSSLFDDAATSPGRDKVEALLERKIGQPLDFVWRPHRDTVTWAPHAPTGPAPELEVHPDAPSPLAPPTREAVAARLGAGLAAALGSQVDVEVTGWHPANVPQSVRVHFPASARVHEDKMQDAVEDKVRTLLPGTWRAEWRTTEDEVVFTDRPDPLAPIVGPPPLPDHVDLAALPVGLRDDGQPWRVRLTQTHVLIGGASGAGKGSVLWSLIRAVSPAVADGSVRLWAIDPKGGMELGRGRGAFERFATDTDDALELLDAAVHFMRARAHMLAKAGSRKHVPTPGSPLLVIVVDEIATLTKYGANKATKDSLNAALGSLLSQGRAVGVCVVGALQDPRKDVLTMRDLFPTRIALRLTEPTACDMLLGAGARSSGARADRIPVEHAGMGYMMVDGSPTPERFRAAWIDDDAIDALVERCRSGRMLTPPAPAAEEPVPEPEWELVDVDDLVEGDRILVDVNGEFVPVTFQAAAESAFNADEIEVEYIRDDGEQALAFLDDDTRIRRRATAAR